DVGIAEQHSVTFSAGLAAAGMIPFCAIYSTFLQRAYDQVIHDVAIQKLPVRFLIDRAGFVGNDGATHHGSFDISMLINLPNFVVMSPSSAQELELMINTLYSINDKPSAVRYPRESVADNIIITDKILEIGKGKMINQGNDIAILSFGDCLKDVLLATQNLNKDNINPTIFDLRFAKPIDEDSIKEISLNHNAIICIEDGGSGGLCAAVLSFLNSINYRGIFQGLYHQDFFAEHMSREKQKMLNKIDHISIYEAVMKIIK
ncbi:MAG: 1-deoxy-D-xylulose-5-phosphate synthase, partial [Chlamydiae bacterium]|nr:1-deoxy-D-xylulose-5-phosphate synthase [Chlamydiota bacterium]